MGVFSMGNSINNIGVVMTPLKSIRKYCVECSGGQYKEVKECVLTNCPLYPYRMGHNPSRQGLGRKDGVVRKIGH